MNDPTNTLIYEIKNSLPPDSTLKHQVLFPGILLARYRLQGATCTVQHSSWPGLYIFSNGREGSMGWQLNSGKQIYLHRQAFACHAASACTQAILSLPNGFYEGLSLFFNLPVIKNSRHRCSRKPVCIHFSFSLHAFLTNLERLSGKMIRNYSGLFPFFGTSQPFSRTLMKS